MSNQLPDSPPLSIVVATTQPWPELRPFLPGLLEQARGVGAELIIADGDGRGLPEDLAVSAGLTWIRSPGDSIYKLRAMAMAKARGDIVAVTEDHCRVRPDWAANTLKAHREFPDAAVIGGAVENGATGTLIDWASFIYTHGVAMSPLGTGPADQIVQLNLSYKRRVLPGTVPELGRMEFMLNNQLQAEGHLLLVDDRIAVDHVQSLGFREMCRLHYHSSRAVSGFRLPDIGVLERGVRIAACPVMPPLLFARAILPVIRKGRFDTTIARCLPLLALLVTIRAGGAFMGLVFGPGGSPRRVR